MRRMLARKGPSRRRTAESGKGAGPDAGRCSVVAGPEAAVVVAGAAAAGAAGIAVVAAAADAVNRTWRREGAGLLCGAGMVRDQLPSIESFYLDSTETVSGTT
ncbi:hypothetical protein TPA0905_72670 [Streptomyces olivaceus]|nr:hypothetical protein TPA0905_72670 [Streptomyces olivaceus]